tara:strand:+ start:5267 stop:5926 length:660 start_codon:yes stop_codon:yes gene_type:complete
MWDFRNESTHPAAGANNAAGRIAGYQPYYFLGRDSDNAYKRNVIKTDKGWVRRQTNSGRIRDEVLVAAGSKESGGVPDVAQIYVSGSPVGNTNANVYVVFNEPVQFVGGNSGNNLSITIANTAGGNHAVAICNSNPVANPAINANNTLVFVYKTQGGTAGSGAASGTYQVNAQSITVVGGGASLCAWGNTDAGSSRRFANLVITGAVSNNMSTWTVASA